MLSNITWTEFLGGIFLLTVAYYLYIGIRFYPGLLKKILGKVSSKAVKGTPFLNTDQQAQELDDQREEFSEDQSDLDDIEELIKKLVSAIETASAGQLDQSELQWSLELLLREKPSLKSSPYRPSINGLIVSECAKHGTYPLSEKDVDKMWGQ